MLDLLTMVFKHGTYIDMWTVPHILAGALMFLLIQRYKKDIWFGFFLTLVFSILWEYFEIYFNINETIYNQISDISITMVGYLIMIASRVKYEKNYFYLKFFGSLYLFFNFIGWLSFVFRE